MITTRRPASLLAALAASCATAALCVSLAHAADAGTDQYTATRYVVQKSGPQGDTWASIAKLPDWSGAWNLDAESFGKVRQSTDSPDPKNVNVPKLRKKYWDFRMLNKVQNKGLDGKGATNNAATCIPDGVPGIMSTPMAFEYLFTPGRVTIIAENGEVRRIWTDGRKHQEDPDLKFSGDSIGHWEGDTLVVHTQSILPRSELFVGLQQTEGTEVLERIHKVSPTKLQIDTVVANPDMLEEPFRYTRTYEQVHQIQDALCQENNRDNNGSVDLTPPTP
ncbi:MAG: hypothetical protein QM718_11730 [Steroidobacteraceae bacterium]